jgi:hypothetical protein
MATLATSSTDLQQEQSSRWQWAQIGIAYTAIQVALWTDGTVQSVSSLLATVFIIGMTMLGGRSARQLGLTLSNVGRALWVVPLASMIATTMLFAASAAGTLRDPHAFLAGRAIVGYGIWALVQQFMLQSFFFVRVESALGSGRKACWAAAALFAAAHIPNPALVVGTMLSGLLLCEFFRRYRNIYPLGMAHAILGFAIALSLPDWVLRHMRVGIAFLTFQP